MSPGVEVSPDQRAQPTTAETSVTPEPKTSPSVQLKGAGLSEQLAALSPGSSNYASQTASVRPRAATGAVGAPVQMEEGAGGESEAAAAAAAAAPVMKAPAKLPKGAVDKEGSKKLLQDAFGSYRTIVTGKMYVFNEADFKIAYDKIYGKSKYAWDKYIKPGPGTLEGFQYGDGMYINADECSIDTIPHEMLHANNASDFIPFVGSEFNEGTTEYLTIKAMTKAGKKHTNSYPDQRLVVEKLVGHGLGEDALMKAYFKGDAKTSIGAWIDKNCMGSFALFKEAMQAKNWTQARILILPKS